MKARLVLLFVSMVFVAAGTSPALAQPAQPAVWKLIDVQVDPDKRTGHKVEIVDKGVEIRFQDQSLYRNGFLYRIYLKNEWDLTWTGKFSDAPAELVANREYKLVSEVTVGGARKGFNFLSAGRIEMRNVGEPTISVFDDGKLVKEILGTGKSPSRDVETERIEYVFKMPSGVFPGDPDKIYLSQLSQPGTCAVFTYQRDKTGTAVPPPPPPPVDKTPPPVDKTLPPVEKTPPSPPCKLFASLACGNSIDLVPGEPSKICGIYVRDWKSNTADRVTVTYPKLEDATWGYLPGGIVVFPGNTSEDPGNMFNAGVSDQREYYFSQFYSAKSTAPPGKTKIDIIVAQKGCGEVKLTLEVNVLPRRQGPLGPTDLFPIPTGRIDSFAGEWATDVGPMVIRVDGNRVSGSYAQKNGVFVGEVKGEELIGWWRDKTGQGRIRLVRAPDGGRTLVGTWVRTGKDGGRGGFLNGTCIDPGNPEEPDGRNPAETSKLTLQAGKRRVLAGGIVKVPVWLINGKGLANVDWELTYDPAVLQPEGEVLKGYLSPNTAVLNAKHFDPNKRGTIYGSLAQKLGFPAPGTGPLAEIPFRAIGKTYSKTALKLTALTIETADGAKPAIELINGSVHIVGPGSLVPGTGSGLGPGLPVPPGPVPPTGLPDPGAAVPPLPMSPLTALDAMRALMMSAKVIPPESNLDVNQDGKVDSTDARLILQDAVPRRPSAAAPAGK